ncbi:MAG: xanthine dehydrogenase family protein molybdopterin-binding subunit [Thermomicrobiales bacterium]
MATAFKYVGKATKRQDGPKKLTGEEQFAGDMMLPRMAHARLVNSIYANAKINSIDTRAARALPGVIDVCTADDLLPLYKTPPARLPLAQGRVVFYGQPVAVVLAQSEAIAAEAAALVQVDYEPLPVVMDAERAMDADSPHAIFKEIAGNDEMDMHAAVAAVAEEKRELPPNVAAFKHYHRGDIAQGIAECDVVITRKYKTNWVHQSYIEPHATVAMMDNSGTLSVWTSTQAMFYCRSAVAQATGLPENKVRMTAMPVGGGFGGKFLLYEPLTAILAMKVHRPVRFVLTRMEEFLAANPAPGCVIELTTGAKRDGTIHALKAKVVFDTGAFPGAPSGIASLMLGGYYKIPHLEIETYDVHTNKINIGAYRAPGVPQATFAIESNISQMAKELGMDDITFRLKNIAEEGDLLPDNTPWAPVGLRQCLEALQQHPAWTEPKGENEGIGIAVGAWFGGLEPASAACRLNADGSLALVLGSQDITGTNTSFALMAAEVFGIEVEKVQIISGNTDTAPYAGSAGGSKILYTVGPAVIQAVESAKKQLLQIAAEQLEASPEDLEIVDDKVRVKGAPGQEKPIAELARMTMQFGGRYAPVYGSGTTAQTNRAPGSAAHLVRVKADPETGDVRLLRYVAAQDVGRAINPASVDGQIMGGVAQGIGWGLYEGMVYDNNGTLLTASFLDYAVPAIQSIPPIETIIVEIPAPVGPFGGKGIGEPPVIPGAGAIANAIADAIGVRVYEIPMTPERVVRAAQANGA